MSAAPNIVIIDCGLGNLFSVHKASISTGFSSTISSDPYLVQKANGIIIPGVGAYRDAMAFLKSKNLDEAIVEKCKQGVPILGICLGMQLLFSRSTEFGSISGLSLVEGEVSKFSKKYSYENKENEKRKVPHIGWSAIYPREKSNWKGTILQDVNEGERFYFVHSYYCTPSSKDVVLSVTRYMGQEFCSTLEQDNVTATQWHPEKSSATGLKIYECWRSFF